MARQPRTQVTHENETVGFLNLYAVKNGARTMKIAWQAVGENDRLALIADKLAGVYTREDGKVIEIDYNPVSNEVDPDDLF